MPNGRWAFDEGVTAVFDDMLERSIPQYELMRAACVDIARTFIRPDDHKWAKVVDLGCSRGGALAPLVEEFGARCRYLGVEVSLPMLAAARERFADEIERGTVEIVDHDLREGYPQTRAYVTLCVLTLQFIPIEHRQRILADAYESTIPGGAFILVEKVMGSDAPTDRLLGELYANHKRRSGYTDQEIHRKRLSLEGALVPVTARWNEDLLRGAGFRSVECFWRWMNFSGWVALK